MHSSFHHQGYSSWYAAIRSKLKHLLTFSFFLALHNCQLATEIGQKPSGGGSSGDDFAELEDALTTRSPAGENGTYTSRHIFSMEGMDRRCLINKNEAPAFSACNPTENSQFTVLVKPNNQLEIVSEALNKCLEVNSNSQLRFSPCNHSLAQTFVTVPYSFTNDQDFYGNLASLGLPSNYNVEVLAPRFQQIRSASSNKCVERSYSREGAEFPTLATCSKSPAQFFFTSDQKWNAAPRGLPRDNEFMFGIYTFGNYTLANGEKVTGGVDGGWNSVESMIDHKIPSILWYNNFSERFLRSNDYFIQNDDAKGHRRSYQFGFEPTFSQASKVREVLEGKWDEFLFNYFIEAKASARKHRSHYYFRFASEMNGNWTSWGGAKNSCDVPNQWGVCANASTEGVQNYIKMWKRVYSIARTVDSRRKFISFVWSPVPTSYPSDSWNHMDRYYPGDQYTDWVGLSYYAGNPIDQNGLDHFYATYTSKKPAMFSEGASPLSFCKDFAEHGPYSDKWVDQIFNDLESKYPRIRAFYWFNVNKECEWRFTVDQGTKDNIKKRLQNPRYTSQPF